jgi:pimeloyl-ACP methyl ester carboxylesterase
MRVAFRRVGAGPRIFVLVHGLGVSGAYFVPLARILSRSGLVVVPDLPGTGHSAGTGRPLGVGGQADVLAGLLEHTGRGEPPVLVGNSLGCQVIVDLVSRSLAPSGPLVLIGPSVDPVYRSVLRQLGTMALDLVREPPALLPLILRDYLVTGPAGVLATAQSALADRPEEKLPRIESPVLVLRGERDALTTSAWTERCARLAPRGRFVSLPGAAHAPHFSHPALVAHHVRSFLAECDDRSA